MSDRRTPLGHTMAVSVIATLCLVATACSSASPQRPAAAQPASAPSRTAPAPTPTPATHTAAPLSLHAKPPPPVYRLTGLPAPSPAEVRRPALAVKIDNVVGAWPQSGLNQADVVFDILVEGGLTRLMAVYQSHGAHLVGPVRSARPVDAWLLRLLRDHYFAFSGASRKELRPVRRLSHAVLVFEPKIDAPFWRRSDHAEPHNLFSSTARLYHTFRAIAHPRTGPRPIFTYSRRPPQGHRTTAATVPFPAATAGWTWAGNRWLRTQDGHRDMLMSGKRVSATNVVILSVRTAWTGIFETDGSQDPRPVTVGSGKCWVLRNGRRVPGTWHSARIGAPLLLYDSHHHRIPLQPGRTWVELMPRGGSPTFRG